MFLLPYFFISHSATIFASSTEFPQNSLSALNPIHTSGREGWLKIAHFKSSVSCMHRTPASFPSGMPGMGELIEICMQQTPHPDRHSMVQGQS